jgi:hypothetical protein
MPDLLERYFWLLCGLWMGGGGAIITYFKLSVAVTERLLQNDVRLRFVKGWFVAFMVPCTVFWLLQLSAGPASTPIYLQWPNPQRSVAIAVNVTCWIALLWWVWLAQGAVTLSHIYSLASLKQRQLPFGVIGVKILSLIMVAAGVMALMQNL